MTVIFWKGKDNSITWGRKSTMPQIFIKAFFFRGNGVTWGNDYPGSINTVLIAGTNRHNFKYLDFGWYKPQLIMITDIEITSSSVLKISDKMLSVHQKQSICTSSIYDVLLLVFHLYKNDCYQSKQPSAVFVKRNGEICVSLWALCNKLLTFYSLILYGIELENQ